MNTTAVGNALESAVFEFFKGEIEEGRFFAGPDCAQVHRQKGYYSRDRQSDIRFDVSIEVFMPGAEEYSLVYLIECKNYARSVGVGEVEAFFAKAQQVGSGAVKCVLVTTSPVQEGALEFARAKRIGLMRHFESSGFKWTLQRSPSSLGSWKASRKTWPAIERALTQTDYPAPHYDFYGSDGDTYTTNANGLLWSLISGGEEQALLGGVTNGKGCSGRSVDFLPHEQIEDRTGDVLSGVGYEHGPADLRKICDREARAMGLRLNLEAERSDTEEKYGMLGRIRFDPLEITIFGAAEEFTPRQRFTLAHELGHYFLGHGQLMSSEFVDAADLAGRSKGQLAPEQVRRMEIQANLFAASLLMPRASFATDTVRLAKRIGLRNKGYGLIYVDGQRRNLDSFYCVSDGLRRRYGVSREAVRLRLKRLGLLKENRRDGRVDSILSSQFAFC